MGMSAGIAGRGGRGHRRRGRHHSLISEINVTPFVDVMLVLLIIFMVAAPLSTVDLPIDLPTSTAAPQKKPDKPTYVTIKSDLAVFIGETPVKRVDLVRTLESSADAGKDKRRCRTATSWRCWRPCATAAS
jgi:biopolymer transport protein ExbD